MDPELVVAFRNAASGRWLTVNDRIGGSPFTSDVTDLTPAQMWSPRLVGADESGRYLLYSFLHPLWLIRKTREGSASVTAAPMTQWVYSYTFQPRDDSTYRLKAPNPTEIVLDEAVNEPGHPVAEYPAHDGPNQRWEVVNVLAARPKVQAR